MKKILILNNHKDTMSLIKKFLQKHSFEAEYMYREETDNVMEKVKEFSPDLVILEASVGPEGELCQSIKSNSNTNVPVILMRGNIASDKLQENCGADDVIAKPFEPALLLSKINKLLKTG